MKVLHVAPSIAQSYGGPTNSLAGYALASRHAGIEVSIAAPHCALHDLDSFVSRAGQSDLHLFPSFGVGAFNGSPALVHWVRRAARSYDVVHVHGLFNPTSSLSARMALDSRTPLVLRPFGTLSKYTLQHRRTMLKRAWLSLVERRNLNDASALHFTTKREKTEANWHGIDFTGRSFVVPPPSLALEVRAPDKEIPDGPPKVIFIGRINPIKNLECLLDAWRTVQSRIPDARLEVAGDGETGYLDSLHQRAAQNGIASRVAFLGFIGGERKEMLLSSAALLVLPSHHENFGVAVLEALEAGLPVVVSPEVHLADFVQRNGVGRIAESTPEKLADAICDVIGDKLMRTHARERGAGLASENFSPAAIGELLSVMYQATIERSSLHSRS